MADLDDAVLTERIADLKAIRDQAKADAERIEAALDNAGNQPVSPDVLKTFARTARGRLRLEHGGYRRYHLRALAQRVEVADKRSASWQGIEVGTAAHARAASSGPCGVGVHSSVLKWRAKYHRIHDFLRAAPPDHDGRNSS